MIEQVFNYEREAEKVKAALKEAFPANEMISTREGYKGRVHVAIVSPEFTGLPEDQKQERVWAELRSRLGADAQAVSLAVAYAPDELM